MAPLPGFSICAAFAAPTGVDLRTLPRQNFLNLILCLSVSLLGDPTCIRDPPVWEGGPTTHEGPAHSHVVKAQAVPRMMTLHRTFRK